MTPPITPGPQAGLAAVKPKPKTKLGLRPKTSIYLSDQKVSPSAAQDKATIRQWRAQQQPIPEKQI